MFSNIWKALTNLPINYLKKYFFNCVSWWVINWFKNGAPPASITTWARSAECLLISDKANALILLRLGSGYCNAKTKAGVHPDYTTAFASY